jgi:hypothetical protein
MPRLIVQKLVSGVTRTGYRQLATVPTASQKIRSQSTKYKFLQERRAHDLSSV